MQTDHDGEPAVEPTGDDAGEHKKIRATFVPVDPANPRAAAEALYDWIQQVSAAAGASAPSAPDAEDEASPASDADAPTDPV